MKRTASVIALVLMGSLLATSDVRGGAGGLVLPTKTTGPTLTATVVIDVTGGSGAQGKGFTSIRVQKAGSTTAAQFTSSHVASFTGECIAQGFDLQSGTDARFVGFMNGWVDDPAVLSSLIGTFGNPNAAAITGTDSVACTAVSHSSPTPFILGPGVRQVLSFSAVIQFQP
jgi:hypothetical protein